MVVISNRAQRDEFRKHVKEEWVLMWRERFDDKLRAEGIVAKDYPLLFMDRGFIVFASREAKTPTFSEIIDFWASRGMVYAPEPQVGGWGKFIRTELRNVTHSRARVFVDQRLRLDSKKQQLKKGGRGWLHV